MTHQYEQDLIRDMLYGRSGYTAPPRHLGRLPRLAANAADEAARSDEAQEAAELLMALDRSVDAVTSKHGSDGSSVLWGILGSLEAVASSHIENEGTSLRLDDMRDAIRGMRLPSSSDRWAYTDVDIETEQWIAGEKRSVLQCAGATKRLLAVGVSFLEVCWAHGILTCGHPGAKPGMIRSEGDDVSIMDRLGRVAFAPPLGGDDIPVMLRELVSWTADRCNTTKELEPLKRYAFISAASGIAHLRFETIHPFCDGNGRIGRSFAESIVAAARPHFNHVLPVGIAAAFSEPMQRSAYYAALGRGRDDETEFAAWWCEQVQEAATLALDRIEPDEIGATVSALREQNR